MMRHQLKSAIVGAIGVGALMPTSVTVSYAQQSSPVKFAPGNFGTMVSGTITGHEYVDYLLGAKAGQEIFAELSIAESNGDGSIYFNILPPGSDGVAIYNSANDGNSTTVQLRSDGTYAIRVYQLGNDADTDKTTEFNLDLSIQ